MGRRGGNAFRATAAPLDAAVLNNLPGRYPAENWHVQYWTVDRAGIRTEHTVTLQLPAGYAAACRMVSVGHPGCVLHVRRWGVACRPSLLEAAGFDPADVVGPDASDEELLHVCFAVTHFDLPGGFVIADIDHPLRLFGPDGALRGSSITGISLLGALAFLASGGRVASDFQRTRWENQQLYRQALAELLPLLQGGQDGRG
jgi:hypothetical protein